ncbi:hypothetical protein, partial [Bacillus sp. WP8]|uniref:hypothetical protein n=1 Tax=Bacillus sp. WP8 TaxID=756828 RepID=UPI0037BF1E29
LPLFPPTLTNHHHSSITTCTPSNHKQFKPILHPKPFTLKTLPHIPFTQHIQQTPQTFQQNPIIKPHAIQTKPPQIVIPHDSPLSI